MVHDQNHSPFDDQAGDLPDIFPSRAQFYHEKEKSNRDGGIYLPLAGIDELRMAMDQRQLDEGSPEYDKRILADGIIWRAHQCSKALGMLDGGVGITTAELRIINNLAWPLKSEPADDDHLATVTSLEFAQELDTDTILPPYSAYGTLGQLGISEG